jgi:hypothetical protein
MEPPGPSHDFWRGCASQQIKGRKEEGWCEVTGERHGEGDQEEE